MINPDYTARVRAWLDTDAPARFTSRDVCEALDLPFDAAGLRAAGMALRALGCTHRRNQGTRYWLRPGVPQGPRGEHATAPTPQIATGLELRAQTTKVRADGSLDHRYDKTGLARPDGYDGVPEGHHVAKETVRVDGDGRVGLRYVTTRPDVVRQEREMLAAWERHAALYAGLAAAVPTPGPVDDDLITLYPLGDPHQGLLAWAPETGENYDLEIGARELVRCVRIMVDRAPPSKRAIITNLGDFYHAQDGTNRTPTSGHQLDVDGRWPKVLDAGHAVLRAIVDAALTKHEHVTIRNLPGNHDPRVAVELMFWLRAVYEREPRVHVADAYAHIQYDHFGTNLFGWTHGDAAKPGELPAIMAADHDGSGTGLWGATSCHVWHTGHVHHLNVHESPGCIVETHRTLAARDAYHAKRYRAGRSLQAITYHRAFGYDGRVNVELARVRAALKGQAA